RGLSRRSVASTPGVSRNSSVAGVVFFGLNCSDNQVSRASGILATPCWPCWLLAGSGFTPVSHSNTVLLPEPEYPAMPTFMVVVCGGCVNGKLPLSFVIEPNRQPPRGRTCADVRRVDAGGHPAADPRTVLAAATALRL